MASCKAAGEAYKSSSGFRRDLITFFFFLDLMMGWPSKIGIILIVGLSKVFLLGFKILVEGISLNILRRFTEFSGESFMAWVDWKLVGFRPAG